jgi:hypothetical protein
MPIEIREMQIKINVDDKGKTPPAGEPDDKGKIIEACLEEVARMLKDKDER